MNSYCKPGTPLAAVYMLARAQGRRPEYIDGLENATRQASAEAMAICQEWYGPYFAWPGHGGVPFVVTELDRAERAVRVVDRMRQEKK